MKKIYSMLFVFLLIGSGKAFAQTNYYSKAAATDFNDVNSWGSVADGSGAAPASISNADYFTVSNNSVMTLSANAAVGKLTISSGSLTLTTNNLVVAFPTGNNSTLSVAGGTLTVSGGNLFVNGNFSTGTGGKFNQSGGNISVDGNNAGVAATSVASGTFIVSFAPTANADINLTGGVFTIVDPHYTTTNTFQVTAPAAGSIAATGTHTFRFGDGVSTDNGGTNGFGYYSWNGTGVFKFKNVVLERVSGGTNRFFFTSGTFFNFICTGDLTISSGAEYRNGGTSITTGASYFTGNIINNGTFTTLGGVVFADATAASSTSLTVTAATNAQTVSGSGVFRNLTASPTANFNSITFNNTSTGGVTLPGTTNIAAQPANSASVSGTLTFTNGRAFVASGGSVVLGTATPATGTLVYTAGGFGTGTKFGRWYTTTTTGSTFTASTDPSTVTSRYPFAAANLDRRSAWLNRVTPTGAGVLFVAYTEGTPGTAPVSITDGAYTVTAISNDSWTVSGTAAAATYGIAIVAPNVYGVAPPDASSRVVRAADAPGTYLAGTTTPGGQRTGLNSTDIASTFYLGISLATCTGTPNAGTPAATTYNVCAGATQVLTVTGLSTGIGISYQWESSADGLTGWVNVVGGSGAATASYTTPAFASTIYYRLKTICSASSSFNYSPVITVTTPAAPATQASAFTATTITAVSATLNWTAGSGNNRTVYINSTNSFTDPVTPNTPGTAATVWANAGQQLVYDGTGTSVAVTGLTGGTTYYVRIYESQKCTGPAAWYYNTATAANNPGNFTTLTPPSNDLVCNAINLVVDDPAPVCVNTTAATTTASDPDITSCSSPNNTVWYKFTPTNSGVHVITASVPAASTAGMSAWLFTYTATGTCPGALTFTAAGGLSCTAGPSSAVAGTTTAVSTTALTAGTTYYIYVDGNSGSFGDVCLRVSGPTPMSYVSSTTTQPVVTSVSTGTTNNQIVALNVVVSGSLSPLTLTNINFNTNGTTLAADISSAKVYYTGTSSTFSTTTQFGTAYLNPNGTFSVTGSQALTGATGTNTTNYFWLAYDVACNATVTDVLDAEVASFDMGSNYIPAVTAPAGSRAITALYAPTRADGNGTTAITLGSINAPMAYGLISGSAACPASVTSVDFTVSGTNPAADINLAKCFYTTTSTFSNAIPFGTAIANPAAGTITFTAGTPQALATGNNYFWLAYDINCAGTVGDNVNGDVNTIYVGGTPYAVTGTATAANALAALPATYTTVVDGDWSSPGTWACGNIPPTAATAVAINNNITVTTAGNVAGDVTIATGKTLSVSSGGVLTMGTSSAGAASGNSNKTLTGNGTLTIDGGILNVNGGIVLNTTSTFNISRGTLNIDPNDGTSATSYAGSNGAFYILTSNLNATGGAINILDPMYTASAGTGQSVISYSVTTTDAALGTACPVTFGGGDDQNALNVNGFYVECNVGTGTLEIGTGIIAGGRFAAQREVTTRQSATNYITKFRNLTVNAGAELVMTAGSAPLGINGNIVNNGVITNAGATTGSGFIFGDVQYSAGVVIAPLTTAQSISGTGFFKKSTADADPTAQTGNIIGSMSVYHLVSSPGLTLGMPLTVTNNLRLLKGKVNTTSANILALGNGTALAGNPATLTASTGTLDGLTFSVTTPAAYDGGHVAGPFNRWFTATTTVGQQGLMPVGSDTSRVAQILFTTAPTTGGYLTANWTDGTGSNSVSPTLNQAGVTPSTISLVTKAQWDIVNGGTLTGGTYTAAMNDKKANAVLSFANAVLLKRPTGAAGTAWEDDGAGGPIGVHVTSTGSNTSITAGRSGLTTFSAFAIGGGINVIPVSVEYFTGTKQAAGNVLNWKVNSSSTSTLSLERSTDKVNYKSINAQTATVDRMLTPFTYTDAAPEAGINYYRVKITNADGESKYTNVVALLNKEKGFELISIVPNPVQHITILSVSSAKAGKMDLTVSDATGKVVMKQSINVIAGNNPVSLNFSALAAGTYQITAINADGDNKSTRFVKF